MRFVIIGNPGNRRVELFQTALAGLQLPPAHLIPYSTLISGQIRLADVIQRDDIVRIESSGQDWDVERSILRLGAEQVDDEEGVSYESMPVSVSDAIAFDVRVQT